MARTRNWSARTAAEVYIRLTLLEQPAARVASAVGLSYQQVHHFEREQQRAPDRVPPCNWPATTEEFEQIRAEVEAKTAEENQQLAAVARERSASVPLDRTAELEAELIGCIDLVRQAASQFGITPRKFLWLCTTHARSA